MMIIIFNVNYDQFKSPIIVIIIINITKNQVFSSDYYFHQLCFDPSK